MACWPFQDHLSVRGHRWSNRCTLLQPGACSGQGARDQVLQARDTPGRVPLVPLHPAGARGPLPRARRDHRQRRGRRRQLALHDQDGAGGGRHLLALGHRPAAHEGGRPPPRGRAPPHPQPGAARGHPGRVGDARDEHRALLQLRQQGCQPRAEAPGALRVVVRGARPRRAEDDLLRSVLPGGVRGGRAGAARVLHPRRPRLLQCDQDS
mmetsp:Transcript_226/g.570  ORF Transcript_226/g.570 Transcript_226/m.570 type:complete len:209 (+) Transcript_226:229-855(+)